MSYYNELYLKRLNHFGKNHQERVQTLREINFEKFLQKSSNLVAFEIDGVEYRGALERYKQDDTRTLMSFLTYRDNNIPNGTVVYIYLEKEMIPYMFYWKEYSKSGGYLKYTLVKLTHLVKINNSDILLPCYFVSSKNQTVKEMLQKVNSTFYSEDDNLDFILMPYNDIFEKDSYINLTTLSGKKGNFRITNVDYLSLDGVAYISIDPVFSVNTEKPQIEDTSNDYWLGGITNE